MEDILRKKKNAIMLADTRVSLVGTTLLQLQETNPGLFDEAIVYYLQEISLTDQKLLNSIIPCRFLKYTPSLPFDLFNKPRFKLFSELMFARYEMFSFLQEFETVTWLDTDILVQKDLRGIIDAAKKSGAAFIREDPENKTSENPDRMRSCFLSYLPKNCKNDYLYCSGTIVISDKLAESQKCTKWCYEKTVEWADNLNLPDQGVINAAIQEFNIRVSIVPGRIYCCYPYLGRDCSEAAIIHSWGLNKFWNDWYLFLNYPKWHIYYQKWVAMGGSVLRQEFFPKISVVIPTYKPDLELFRQCLDSLMKQRRNSWERFSDFEIIIVAEPYEGIDALEALIGSYNDLRVQLKVNEKRFGIAASLNKGIRLAKGEYIARMDDDDLAADYRLYKQAEYLDRHKEISLCTTDFEYFGDMNEYRVSFEGEMAKAWSIFTCPFDHPTVMFRRDFFAEHNLFYDEQRGYVEDWELWLRAFGAGMKVGCIHEGLFYHRWIKSSSAGQTAKTIEMMRELIQKNFKKLDVEIPTDDLSLIGPWNGKLLNIENVAKVEKYFFEALESNQSKKLYDQKSLVRIFNLRLEEARTGNLPGLVKKMDTIALGFSNFEGENKNYFKNFLKRVLKPLYRPFRKRYENRLVDILNSNWVLEGHALNCVTKLDDVIARQSEQMETLMKRIDTLEHDVMLMEESIKDTVRNQLSMELHRHIDYTYQDLMVVLENKLNFVIKKDIALLTNYPIAYESNDYLIPHGTIQDNTRYPRFIKKCESLFSGKEHLSMLDLGCSGGGMVLDAVLRGHFAIGLEGSDASLRELRAVWRLLDSNLLTCDITKPFTILDKSINKPYCFDIITAWEVLEHINSQDLPQLFENIKRHLASNGYFMGSIANWNDIDTKTGTNWHVTTQPYEWWKSIFEMNGFVVCTSEISVFDLPRGGYNPPLFYEVPYNEIDTKRNFYIVARKKQL